jgi:hypothetical protein
MFPPIVVYTYYIVLYTYLYWLLAIKTMRRIDSICNGIFRNTVKCLMKKKTDAYNIWNNINRVKYKHHNIDRNYSSIIQSNVFGM